jgi:hypothetical protein
LMTCIAGTALLSACLTPAGAVERSLLGIQINSNVKGVLRRFGNPTYVLNVGAATGTQTMGGPGGMNGPGSQYGANRGPGSQFGGPGGSPYGGRGMGSPFGGVGGRAFGSQLNSLPPLQAAGGPVSAFGQAQLPQNQGTMTTTASTTDGEVTLIYELPNNLTYQFLLSPSGSVKQVTALGYKDDSAKTSKDIRIGSSYTSIIGRYGYPENQSETNGVTIVDYSKRAHVAFELINNSVVGIVVAAID